MLEVAAEAGLAKGTTYLYFRTKEELLLELLTQELGEWFAALEAWFQAQEPQLQEPSSPRADLAHAIASGLGSRPRLVGLIAVQTSILEQNLSQESAERFKRFFLAASSRLLPHLEAWFPGCNPPELLQWLNALVIGVAQLSLPSEVIERVLQDQELQVLQVEFQPTLERSLRALLGGITATNRPS